jgi:hypothetical protein
MMFVLPGEGCDSSPSRFKPGEEAEIWRTFSGKVKVKLPASSAVMLARMPSGGPVAVRLSIELATTTA